MINRWPLPSCCSESNNGVICLFGSELGCHLLERHSYSEVSGSSMSDRGSSQRSSLVLCIFRCRMTKVMVDGDYRLVTVIIRMPLLGLRQPRVLIGISSGSNKSTMVLGFPGDFQSADCRVSSSLSMCSLVSRGQCTVHGSQFQQGAGLHWDAPCQ